MGNIETVHYDEKVGAYRHFKGKQYFKLKEIVCFESQDDISNIKGEHKALYIPLYKKEGKQHVYCRDLDEFHHSSDEIKNREDNVTGQSERFKLIEEKLDDDVMEMIKDLKLMYKTPETGIDTVEVLNRDYSNFMIKTFTMPLGDLLIVDANTNEIYIDVYNTNVFINIKALLIDIKSCNDYNAVDIENPISEGSIIIIDKYRRVLSNNVVNLKYLVDEPEDKMILSIHDCISHYVYKIISGTSLLQYSVNSVVDKYKSYLSGGTVYIMTRTLNNEMPLDKIKYFLNAFGLKFEIIQQDDSRKYSDDNFVLTE